MKFSLLIPAVLAALPAAVHAQTGAASLFNSLNSLSPASASISLSSPQFYNGCYPIGPKEAVTADFDGDGFKDLAIAKMEGVLSILYWSQEAQTFVDRQDLLHQPIANYDGSDGYRGVAAADLDRDGHMDAMAISPFKGVLFRYRNLGSHTFDPAESYPLWVGARDCAAGDFNGDGITDLIVGGGDYSAGRNTILNYRVLQLNGDGSGGFTRETDLVIPGSSYITGLTGASDSGFPKPVFSFAVYRPLGGTADDVAVTYATTTTVRFLHADGAGRLAVMATTELPAPVHQLEAADVRAGVGPRAGLPALVAAGTYSNEIYYTTADPPVPGPGVLWSWGKLRIEGLPRSVKVADFNGDGRKDLAVIHRAYNMMSLYSQAPDMSFSRSESRPVGRSPRDIVLEDFNHNGKPDAVVLCRYANSVSFISDFPGVPVLSRPGIYPGGKGIQSTRIADLNHDGLQDLLVLDAVKQLLVARLSLPGRKFAAPVSYPARPGVISFSDFNADGNTDVGILNHDQGLSILLGSATGMLVPFLTVPLSLSGVSCVIARDLNGDGLPEIVASNWASLLILRNQGSGQFVEAARHDAPAGIIALAFTDADQDGDSDIIAAGHTSFSLLRNDGNLPASAGTAPLVIETYDFSDGGRIYGNGTLATGDFTGDGDPDVGIGTNAGFQSFRGVSGSGFVPAPGVNPPGAPVATATLEADYDADGDLDVAYVCPSADLMAMQLRHDTGFEQRTWNLIGSDFLATGDLDGDGKADLVGGADYLWAAYSSGLPGQGNVSEPGLVMEAKVVINEVLAVNDSIALPQDGGRTSDYLELYNGSPSAVTLSGWRLTESDSSNPDQVYTFPEGTTLASGGRLVVVYAKVRSPLHTGFRLSGDGSVITLKSAADQLVDSVSLSRQQADVSYARVSDAYPAFVKNAFPDPGEPNLYNGNPGPEIRDKSFDAGTLQAGTPILFRASARADSGISRVQVSWRVLGQPLDQRWVSLFDDGRHQDGLAGDGDFAGTLDPGLPAGTEIEFFYEAADLLNSTTQEPDSPLFTLPGRVSSLFTLKVPDNSTAPPVLEISEVVSNNSGVAVDEAGDADDYVEIRNLSQVPLPLSRYAIRSTLLGTGDLEFIFPENAVLQPGQSLVLWADGEVDEGPWHMPFTIEKSGDRLYIVERSGTAGTASLTALLEVPRLPDNSAWIRLGPGGSWGFGPPSPGRPNARSVDLTVGRIESGLEARLLFPTSRGKSFLLQSSTRISGGWSSLLQGAGDGFERYWQEPVSDSRKFYRIVETP